MSKVHTKSIDKKILSPSGILRTFEDMGVSTKTVIAVTNIRINLDLFYNYVPIVDFIPQEKRRGRKKKINIEVPVYKLPFGSIVMIQRRRDFRGTVVKTKSRKNNTYFLHSVSIIMSLNDNKFVNVKVSANGKFQITGCKENLHNEQTIIALFNNLQKINEYTGESSYNIEVNPEETLPNNNVRAIFNVVMQNTDFNIGFRIYRNKLDSFINKHTNFCSIFEGSINTEVNIKVPIKETEEVELLSQIQYNPYTQELSREKVPYYFYCDLLNKKEKKKEIRKERHHTFLVFASGSVIMSSRGADMERAFYHFIDILLKNKESFEDINKISE
jgi:hypothetical protein